MIYAANITIPANTPAINPTLKRLPVTEGLIYKLEIEFPPGPEGTAHIIIYDGSSPVWPSNPGIDFASDAYTISFDDTYLKTRPPFEFQIYGFNTDTENEHSIQIRLGIVSKDIFIARFLPSYTYKHLEALMAKMEAEEKERARQILAKPFSWL